jgi:hypothetical protein
MIQQITTGGDRFCRAYIANNQQTADQGQAFQLIIVTIWEPVLPIKMLRTCDPYRVLVWLMD